MSDVPRYLVPFHPKRVPHRFADVLIIGGGVAGLRAALAVPAHQSVVVITKSTLRQSNSAWAQGGIASVLDPEDRFEDHIADTLTAGGELCDPKVVEMVVREAPKRIQELIDWGTRFDESLGELALGREGGHSHHRIVHALGDATGKEMMRAIIERATKLPNAEMWENAFTLDLLTHEGVCRGALVWNPHHGKTFVWAKQTILCTGGAGQLYRETTNPEVATGDGLAAAYRAGAEVRDMEFMQFHPTVLYIAGSSRNLITEAMRGEGAQLIDRTGYRFMQEYDARGELAPRDVVSRAIVTQMEKTRHPNVYLDMSHLDAAKVRARFPGIAAICAEFGIDIAKDPIPVRPGAHYMIGGVTVDLEGRTTLPGLWAAGRNRITGGALMPTVSISDAEWQVMNVVWESQPLTAQEVVARLEEHAESAPATIKTMLHRLVRKNVLTYELQGNRYVYRSRARRSDCVRQASRSFVDRVFAGEPAPMLAHFLRTTKLSAAEIRQLREILNEQEAQS